MMRTEEFEHLVATRVSVLETRSLDKTVMGLTFGFPDTKDFSKVRILVRGSDKRRVQVVTFVHEIVHLHHGDEVITLMERFEKGLIGDAAEAKIEREGKRFYKAHRKLARDTFFTLLKQSQQQA
ncbi:MAG: hypothetical protein Q8P13_03070 [bacterium]|nr:hypothetical protein [bacterium]